MKKRPLISHNIAWDLKYEEGKFLEMVPTTGDGKFDTSITSEGMVLSSKIENYNQVSWSGKGAKFNVLFEIIEGSGFLKLKYKDSEPLSISVK